MRNKKLILLSNKCMSFTKKLLELLSIIHGVLIIAVPNFNSFDGNTSNSMQIEYLEFHFDKLKLLANLPFLEDLSTT